MATKNDGPVKMPASLWSPLVENRPDTWAIFEAGDRKSAPVATGVLDYFPLALLEVAKASVAGNRQHVPGQPLKWDRTKSADEADALVRHLMERGKIDADGVRHSAKVAWRALALLQIELEQG